MLTYKGLIDIGKGGAHNYVPRGYDEPKARDKSNSEDPLLDNRLTAAEVIILRHIHGEDAVLKIEVGTAAKRSLMAERKRLEGIYGAKVVKDIFGPPGVAGAIPMELDLAAADESEDGEGDEGEPAPARKTLTLKGAAA